MTKQVISKPESLRVCLVFASRGIGGAERSMLRMMEFAHPSMFECLVVLASDENPEFEGALHGIGVQTYSISKFNLFELVNILQKESPDVVYLFGPSRTVFWAMCARLVGIRAIIGAERSSAERVVDKIVRRLDKFFLDAYICNSQRALLVLRDDVRVSADKLYLIYNGVTDLPPEEYQSAILPADISLPLLICVANIRKLKGQEVLLASISHLRERFPLLQALLVGRDLTNGEFFQLVHSQGLEDTYEWVGFVSDVTPYLARADIFVLPSLYREGTPTSLLEAMVAGLPVIASNVGGVSELIKDGETGILVPPGDMNALAVQIQSLIESPDLRRKLGMRAREYVLEAHSIESMADNHARVFVEILCKKN